MSGAKSGAPRRRLAAWSLAAALGPAYENLHRNVIFRGREVLAIPHNSNGWMFSDATFDGAAMTADYAKQRMRNEPVVEITQVKGTSDTHPALSPNDEWANFEIMTVRVASDLFSQGVGGRLRSAP